MRIYKSKEQKTKIYNNEKLKGASMQKIQKINNNYIWSISMKLAVNKFRQQVGNVGSVRPKRRGIEVKYASGSEFFIQKV